MWRALPLLLTLLAAGCSGDRDGATGATPDGGSVVDAGGEATDAAAPFDRYTLTVGVEGVGVVTSTPPGIRCGNPETPETSQCAHDFVDGQTVSLSVAPASGHRFVRWSGDCDGDDACALVMDEPRYAAAELELVPLPPVSACPAPAAGATTVCGTVYDLADTQPAGGVRVLFYDGTPFLWGDGAPLATVTAKADGTFFGVDLPAPASGKYAVVTDDPAGSDSRARTAVIVPAAADSWTEEGIAFTLRRATDEAWTSSAGNPLDGLTFSEQGAFVGIYIDTSRPAVGPFAGTPASGVTLMASDTYWTAYDYYFTNTGALARTTLVLSPNVTGASGTGIYTHSPVTNYSASGGLPAGCVWPQHTSSSLPDTIVVQVFDASCP